MAQSRTLILVLVGVVFVNLGFTVYLHGELGEVRNEVNSLDQNQSAGIMQTGGSTPSPSATDRTGETANASTVSIPVMAYDSQIQSSRLVNVTITPLETNDIFINILNQTQAEDTQTGYVQAMSLIQQSRYSPATGVLVRIDPPAEWGRVEGTSASLPFAIAYAATDDDYSYNSSVIMTGSLRNDGTVGQVDHLQSKVDAAVRGGYETILVPVGQGQPHPDINVVEVADIESAGSYALIEVE